MDFLIRWSLFIALFVGILTATGAVPRSGTESNISEGINNNDTNGEGSKWQIVKRKFPIIVGKVQYFFTNDIPQFITNIFSDNISHLKSLMKNDIAAVENEMTNLETAVATDIKVVKYEDACECFKYNCGCCQHLEEPTIHLNSTICANVSYLSEDIGLSVTVTVNDYTIFNETVSVRNPPPVCLGIPYVKEWAEACVRFHDIDATRTHFHGCAEVEARMKHVLIAKYELGCFDIGPIKLKSHIESEDLAENEVPSVMLV